MKFFKYKKGFTLSEVMVCIGIIAVISAIIFPAVARQVPKRNKILFKKAYHQLESAITDMVSDGDTFFGIYEDKYERIPKHFAYYNAEAGENVSNTGPRFRSELKRRFNTTGINSDENVFYTNDGMMWTVYTHNICDPNKAVDTAHPGNNYGTNCTSQSDIALTYTDSEWGIYTHCSKNDTGNDMSKAYPYICVTVDVNGKKSMSGTVDNHRGPDDYKDVGGRDADKFFFVVFYDGRIYAPTNKAREYLKVLKNN